MQHHRLIQTFLVAAVTTAIMLAPAMATAGTTQHSPLISERWFQRWYSFRSPTAVSAMRARHVAMAKLLSTPKSPKPVLEFVSSGGFHWADAGVGAGAALAFVAVASGAAVVIRGNRPSRSQGGTP